MVEERSRGLERLPGLAARFAHELRLAGDVAAREAVDRMLGLPGQHELTPVIRNATFAWQLRIARGSKRLVFVFSRRRSTTRSVPRVVIAATLRLRFDLAAPDLPPRRHTEPPRMAFDFAPPPWLVLQPGETGSRRSAPGGAGGEALLLGDPRGHGVLALRALDRREPEVSFDDGNGDPTPVLPHEDGSWPLGPFLLIVGEIARWARGTAPTRAAATLPLVVHDDDSDVARIIYQLARATLRAATVAGRERAPGPFLLDHFTSAYSLSESHADVSLRLKDDGDLAFELEQNSFQLRMSLDSRLRADTLDTRVTLDIPDFLVAGEVLERLVALLRTGRPRERLIEELQGTADAAQLNQLLDDPASRAIAFRVERRQKRNGAREDTDIIALRGAIEGREVLLLISLELEVSADAPDGVPTFEARGRNPLDLIHFGPVGDAQLAHLDGRLSREAVQYFFRLARSLNSWLHLLT